MGHKPEFLRSDGARTANAEFLTEYRRAVLLVLQRAGALDQEQMDACFSKVKTVQEAPK